MLSSADGISHILAIYILAQARFKQDGTMHRSLQDDGDGEEQEEDEEPDYW
jgi:hypothetical protein